MVYLYYINLSPTDPPHFAPAAQNATYGGFHSCVLGSAYSLAKKPNVAKKNILAKKSNKKSEK